MNKNHKLLYEKLNFSKSINNIYKTKYLKYKKKYLDMKAKGGSNENNYKLLTYENLVKKLTPEELESAEISVKNRAREIFNKGIDSDVNGKLVYSLRPRDLRLISKHDLHENYSYIIDSNNEPINNSMSVQYLKEGIKKWMQNMGSFSYFKFYNISKFDIIKSLDEQGNIIDDLDDENKKIIIKKDSNTFEPLNIGSIVEDSKLNLSDTLNLVLNLFNEVKKELGPPPS